MDFQDPFVPSKMGFPYREGRIPGHIHDVQRGTMTMVFVDNLDDEIRVRVRQPSGPEIEIAMTKDLQIHGVRRFNS